MLRAEHPEVLNPDWTPPVLVGRSTTLSELQERLPVEREPHRPRPLVAVRGPSGSGSSVVARRAGLDLIERLRRRDVGGRPLFAPVRVPWTSGPRAIAAELLQRIDPEFVPHGFPVAELLAGFLRRLNAADRPAVVVLDDLGPCAPEIGPILRPLLAPDRFLPEGTAYGPGLWLILAGSEAEGACWERARRAGLTEETTVRLGSLGNELVTSIVRDRAQRALGRPAPDGWAERIAGRCLAAGTGARRAVDLLKREILGPVPLDGLGTTIARPGSDRPAVEPRLLAALVQAASAGPAFLHAIRDWEARLARAEGVRPLPATTFWRRIVRLEAAGIVRRVVRTGGNGGTQSLVELLRPIAGPTEVTPSRGTLRAEASSFGLGPRPI